MVVPTKAYDAPAAAALKKSEEVLTQLDAMTSANPNATAPFQRPEFTKTQEIPKPISSDAALDILDRRLEVAMDDGDEDEVRSVAAEAQDIIQAWVTTLQNDFSAAQEDYQSSAREDVAEQSEKTKRLAAIVAQKRDELQKDLEHIQTREHNFDVDQIVSNMKQPTKKGMDIEAVDGVRAEEQILESLRRNRAACERILAKIAETERIAKIALIKKSIGGV